MQQYDKENQSGMRVIFMIFQIMMFLIVFSIIYTSFIAIGYIIKEQGVSSMAYLPILASVIGFPILLYKYKNMFYKGRMLSASVWTISSSSIMIIALYIYIDKLVG